MQQDSTLCHVVVNGVITGAEECRDGGMIWRDEGEDPRVFWCNQVEETVISDI